MLPLRAAFLAGVYRFRRFVAASPADPPRRWLRRHWKLAGLSAVTVTGLLAFDGWLLTCGFAGCPSSAAIRAYRAPEGGRVIDRSDRTMGRLYVVRRVNVPLRVVPQHVRRAFIATEDRRFYRHDGLDWRAVARAVVRNTFALGVREGFSTITMQVARNTYLAGRAGQGRSMGRKLLEMRLARRLERALTKDQILELYLNAIYLGNGVYGVEGASRDLFGKHVRDLTVAEGALLAALPKGPSVYTPRRNPDRALARRNLVLSLMEREGYLGATAAGRARGSLLPAPRPPGGPRSRRNRALDWRALVTRSAATGEVGTDVAATPRSMPQQRAAQRAATAGGRDPGQSSGWWSEDEDDEPVWSRGDGRARSADRRHPRRGRRAPACPWRLQPRLRSAAAGSAFAVRSRPRWARFTPATVVVDEPVFVDRGNGPPDARQLR